MPSLYVHVPFCIQKCDYCAFYSHSLAERSLSANGRDTSKNAAKDLISCYIKGLESEMAKRQKDAPEGVSSLFIGGGTPTALKEGDLLHLMERIHARFFFQAEVEKTVEGNPGTLTPSKLNILSQYGINRFSLGVQTFSDPLLKAIGRIHNAELARDAIRLLRVSGFQNLNLDLMFGLPGQNLSIWQETLEEAISFSPEHLSLYGLMLEEGTPLYARYDSASSLQCGGQGRDELEGGSLLPDDDLQAEMYDWAVARLQQEGYVHYETSNFARPGYECQHNLSYWRGNDYLGLGPGGVSCIQGVRWKNVENVHDYQRRILNDQDPFDPADYERLSHRERMAERMILGLRLAEGVQLSSFCNAFGADPRDIYKAVMERYKHQDVFCVCGDYLRLNPKYSFVANTILQEFV